MNFRKLKNNFKEEIHKEDIKSVLTNGLITMLLYSTLLGLINIALILIFEFQLTFLIFILGIFLAKRIKESYINYHILYPIISVIFLLIGLLLFNCVSVFAYNQTFTWFYFIESCKIGVIDTLNTFNPIYYISNFNVYELLYLFVIIYTIISTYRSSK